MDLANVLLYLAIGLLFSGFTFADRPVGDPIDLVIHTAVWPVLFLLAFGRFIGRLLKGKK